MLKRIPIAVLFIAVFACLLCGCRFFDNDVLEDSFIIDKTKDCDYYVVYGRNAGDTVIYQAAVLGKEIEKKCGVDVYVQSDWEYRVNDAVQNQESRKRVEILIGETEREQSNQIYSSFGMTNEYVIRCTGDKLIFAATSEMLLMDAIARFKQDYLTNKTLNITISKGFEYRYNRYSFFDIARGGKSECMVVIPDDADDSFKNTASMISRKINEICETGIKVVREGDVSSTKGCILLGNLEDKDAQKVRSSLDINESTIKCVNSKLIIAGHSRKDIVNAIVGFVGNMIVDYDKTFDGLPYIYFPVDYELFESWSKNIPNIPGAELDTIEDISVDTVSISYSDVDKYEFNNYIELIKQAGYYVYSDVGDGMRNVRVEYYQSENGISPVLETVITHSEAEKTVTMIIYTWNS